MNPTLMFRKFITNGTSLFVLTCYIPPQLQINFLCSLNELHITVSKNDYRHESHFHLITINLIFLGVTLV